MKCCICGKEIKGHGNNPSPFIGEACCDHCNSTLVVPMRLQEHLGATIAFKEGATQSQIVTTPTPDEGLTLEQLQEAVGGYIEVGPKVLKGYTTLCDEDGKYKSLPLNRGFYQLFGVQLLGTVVLVPDRVMQED